MIKNDFPIFQYHPSLVYLDSAATTLKPATVINAVTDYYERYSANVGRGLYPIAEEATEKFEETRGKIATLIGAQQGEVVFVHGATEGINLLASALSTFLEKSDNIVVTEIEHHSNFLPWKRAAQKHDIDFRIIPVDADGWIDAGSFNGIIDEDTVIVSLSAISNVLGIKLPIADIVKKIKSISPDAAVIIDASQIIGHSKIDVAEWGADFIVFSGHKMFGPTGIGIVWGRKSFLDKLPPYQLGGGMVSDACATDPIWKDAPYRFEAGTPDIASSIGLGAAVDFIFNVGIENIEAHESRLTRYAFTRLTEAFGGDIAILGSKNPKKHGGLISFTLKEIHPHDLAQILGEKDICIRAGEHCATPIHRKLGIFATARISFSIYNSEADVDMLINEMRKAANLLNGDTKKL